MHHLKHSMTSENKKFNIPVYMEDTATNVRIHDLPPGIPNAVVADYMKQYGKVVSVSRELWKKFFPGVQNGVRVVRIELHKHVPSFVRIQDQLTTVSYRSQIPTCRRCERKAHPKQKCTEVAASGKNHQTTKESSCDTQQAVCVADNPAQINVPVEVDANCKRTQHFRQQQTKRNVRQMSPLDNSPPRKKVDHNTEPMPAVPRTIGNNDNEMEKERNDDESTDSDSGPDPEPDDVAGWRIKFDKRSKRQDKFIAKYCK